MPRGSKPGEHRGGRAAGTPNKPKGEKALVVLDQAEAEVRVLIEAAYRARSFLASGRTWAARPANARGELIRSCTVRSWRRRIRLCGRFPYRPTIGGACGMYRPPIGPVSAIERAIVCMRMPGLADLRQPISRGSRSSASRRKGNVGWPSHPVAICTMCGAPIEDPRFINERCTRRVHGRRCKGTYEITMGPRDWKRCDSCFGLGFRGDRRCNLCWGTGWAYVGEKNY